MHKMLRVCSAVLILLMMGIVSVSAAMATVSVTPSAANFGSVSVSALSSPAVIVMTNTGTEPVFLQHVSSDNSQFIVAGPHLPMILRSHSSISFRVIFQPAAASAISGAITFTMVRNSEGTVVVPLTGSGVAEQTPTHLLSSSSSGLDFGNTSVGTSGSQSLTLSNTGNSPVNISQVNISGSGFTVSGFTAPAALSAGQSVSMRVGYSPIAAGSSAGNLTVTSNATDSPTRTITLAGTGVQSQLSVVPTSVSFGSLAVGLRNTQAVTIRNSGTANLSISQATVTGTGFTITGISLPLNLAVGASTSFTVGFSPASTGSAGGLLTVSSNAPHSPLAVALSGTGLAQIRTLSANPASLNFGSITPNTNSSKAVTLTNTGNFPVTVSHLSVTGAGFSYSGISLPVTLAAGQSASFNAIFDPATSGNLIGSAVLVSTATESSLTIGLTGAGAPVVHSVSLTWDASPSQVTGYNIYSASQSGGPYVRLNSTLAPASGYTGNNLTSGRSYYFVATAVDSDGTESAYSNEAAAIIP